MGVDARVPYLRFLHFEKLLLIQVGFLFFSISNFVLRMLKILIFASYNISIPTFLSFLVKFRPKRCEREHEALPKITAVLNGNRFVSIIVQSFVENFLLEEFRISSNNYAYLTINLCRYLMIFLKMILLIDG